VKNLKTKLLFKIDIIGLERIIVDANRHKLIIKSCRNLKIKLEINSKNNIKIKQVVKIERSLVIAAYSVLKILVIVQDNILSNRNYIFESILSGAYFYVADKNISFVYVCNNRSISLYIL